MKKYSEIYNLNIEDFLGEAIEEDLLSNRTVSRLKMVGISTVGELLDYTPDKLKQIRGFGVGCQKDIERYICGLSSNKKDDRPYNYVNLPNYIAEQLIGGNFEISDEVLTEEQKRFVDFIEYAYKNVDETLIKECIENPQIVLGVCDGLNDFVNRIGDAKKYCQRINPVYLKNHVKFFIRAYRVNEEIREKLFQYCKDEDETLEEYLFNYEVSNESEQLVVSFFEWCQFDIHEEIKSLASFYGSKEREIFVLRERARGKTLEQIGEAFNVSRERIRQIEKKGISRFVNWQKKHRILQKIYAARDGDSFLTRIELREYFGNDTELLCYLYKNSIAGNISYDKQLDVFIVEDKNMIDKVNEYVDSLPDKFKSSKLDDLFKTGVNEYELSEELLDKAITDNYKLTGNIYHRSRLTLTTLYYQVLKNCFPDGLHIYDTDEIKKFRQAAKEEYDIDIKGSDRSIIAVLSKVGILCERGTYKADEGIDLSNELAKKIEDYIDNSEHPVFMTNTIYSVFEKELLEEGVDNKYFLQGLLHKRFDGKWIFRRDYISKDESFTTVYASLVEFIKNSTYPVSKEDIYRAYPGITEIVINIATGDKDILNLFGVYIHSSKLNISAKEKMYLHKKTEEALEKENITHCKEVYENVMQDYPDLLTNNYVNYSFSMYSLLEYLFGDEYSFSRPFIARKGVEITKANTVIQQMVSEADDIEIDTIQGFAKEHHIVIYSILDLVDSCNETHLLINDLELKRIEDIGITEDKVKIIEDILDNEINTTIPVAQLKCINQFPGINYDWNEWLIYSIIKKWSTRFEVATNSKYFKLSAPLISRIGEMDTSKYDAMSKDDIGSIATADNLDDIDNLLLDIDFDELGGF